MSEISLCTVTVHLVYVVVFKLLSVRLILSRVFNWLQLIAVLQLPVTYEILTIHVYQLLLKCDNSGVT